MEVKTKSKSQLFEEAVFGTASDKKFFFEQIEGGNYSGFRSAVRNILKNVDRCPDTHVGTGLHRQISNELDRVGIDSQGLVLIPTARTSVDVFHSADGVIYLPSYPLVRIDAFHINPEQLRVLKSRWIDNPPDKSSYSNLDFQNDLFRYKKGFWEYLKKTGNVYFENEMLIDFRLMEAQRPEDLFILTPDQACNYEGRREFAKLIAGYFAKVAGLHKEGRKAS